MPDKYCVQPASAFNVVNAHYGLPTTSFKAPLVRTDGFVQEMSKGDSIPRCFLPADVVVLDVPGETLRINNTIVSISELIHALHPITGTGAPNKSPTGYGSKSTVYIDTVGKITYYWDGSQWIPLCGCSNSGTTPTPTPVTPTCSISALPASVLNSTLVQGTAVNISVVVTNAPSDTTVTVVSGALPTGLNVNYSAIGTTGTLVISGTPTQAGSSTSILKVGNTSCNVNVPLALTVAASNNGGGTPTPTPTPTPTQPCTLDAGGDWLHSAVTNSAINVQRNLTGKIPAGAVLQLVSGSLAPGFSLKWAYPYLTLSGTCITLSQGQYAVYRFTDSATGCSIQFQVRVDVQNPSCSMTLASSTLTSNGTVGTSLAVSTKVTNAPSGSDVLLESGALPSGVTCSFNQQTGTLAVTGTPTAAGTYTANYYVGTVDCWRLATINIAVANAAAPCTITTTVAQIADGTLVVGTPMVPHTVFISNIPSDATITATGDPLPAGITVTPNQVGSTLTAVFAGTPTVAGNSNSSVRIGNTAGCALVIPISFAVSPARVVPTPTPGGGGGGGTGGCNIVSTEVNTAITGTVGTALSF